MALGVVGSYFNWIALHAERKQWKPKDIFPETMSSGEIDNAIRQAYRRGSPAGPTQYGPNGVTMYVKGSYDGMDIYMYVNKTTGTIETAWPKYP